MEVFLERHALVLITCGLFLVALLVASRRPRGESAKGSRVSVIAGGIAVLLAVVHSSIYGG